jgi:hypothetical protein
VSTNPARTLVAEEVMHCGPGGFFFFLSIFVVKLSWLYRILKYFYIHPHCGCKIIFSPILIIFSSNFGFFVQKIS